MGIKAGWVAIALLLSACNVGPEYERPSLWTPGSWFSRRPPATEASLAVAEPLDPSWWDSFNDPALTRLVRRVAAQNLDVRAATARVAQSRAQRRVVGADALPQVNGNASYTRERLSEKGVVGLVGGGTGGSSNPALQSNGLGGRQGGFPNSSGIGSAFDLFQYGFDASWELDIWGRVRRGIEAADAQTLASEDARRGALVSALSELARDYVQLRGVQDTARITRSNLDSARQSARLTAERFRGGLATDLDVASAEGQVSTTAANLPQLAQQEAQLANAIALLLGEPPGARTPELTDATQPGIARVPPLPSRVPIGLPSELVLRRPDIRQAEAQLHAATAQIGAAEAEFFPRITLTGSFAFQALQFRDLGDWGARTYGLGPAISIPIFQGGRLRGQLELRRRQEQEAATNYQKAVLQAFHEVDNALIAYQAEQRRATQLARAAQQNRRALGLAQQRFRQGLSDFLGVLTAQRSVLAVEQSLAESRTNQATNLVQLYKALGGGWEPSYPASEARVAAAPR